MIIMNCTLCQKEITKYDTFYHHLPIDENHSADICEACIEAFTKWQQQKYAVLFPTKAVKKMYGKQKNEQ